MTLDEVFASKRKIADNVFSRLYDTMKDFGYEIIEALVTGVVPNEMVKQSMNEVNASKRIKDAAPHKAEANKVKIVKEAEAQVEALYLSGTGTANERKALAAGMKNVLNDWSMYTFTHEHPCSAKVVMDILLITQYLDLLGHIGSNELLVRHGPGEPLQMRADL